MCSAGPVREPGPAVGAAGPAREPGPAVGAAGPAREPGVAPTIRPDPETGGWRLLAPGRAARPDDVAGPRPCPFCPGNEAMTPPEVFRLPAGEGRWRVRAFANLFPLLVPGRRPAAGPGAFAAAGRHEVIVESPEHDWDLRNARPDEAAELFRAARDRCRALAADGPAAVVVFRNQRRAAGTSLRHPHRQIAALDRVPPGLARRWWRARAYAARTGRSLHQDLAAAERRARRRVVVDDHGVFGYATPAPLVSYHLTLMPPGGAAHLADASDADLAAVAAVLPPVLRAVADVLGDPAYNLVVHAGPVGVPDAAAWYRWHLGIYPRTGVAGGLEIATDLAVATVAPEDAATALRAALP